MYNNTSLYMSQQPPSGPRRSHYRGFTITLRHTTVGRTPLDEWATRRRDIYLTTHNTHTTFGDIRTRNLSKPEAADPRLRPRGHLDQQCRHITGVLISPQSDKEGNKLQRPNQQRWVTLHVDSLALWKIINEEDAVLIPKNRGENFSIGFLHSVGLWTYQHPCTYTR
jgi:hypothetical protein